MPLTDFEDPSAALPCAGGLIAGTFALMTCWAAPERSPQASQAQQRLLMARKIASNLFFLREHPDLAPGLRHVIGKAHERWVLLAHALTADSDEAALTCAPRKLADKASALH